MWLAPNLVTLSGLFCLILAYATNAYYLPDFVGARPAASHRAAGSWPQGPLPLHAPCD